MVDSYTFLFTVFFPLLITWWFNQSFRILLTSANHIVPIFQPITFQKIFSSSTNHCLRCLLKFPATASPQGPSIACAHRWETSELRTILNASFSLPGERQKVRCCAQSCCQQGEQVIRNSTICVLLASFIFPTHPWHIEPQRDSNLIMYSSVWSGWPSSPGLASSSSATSVESYTGQVLP